MYDAVCVTCVVFVFYGTLLWFIACFLRDSGNAALGSDLLCQRLLFVIPAGGREGEGSGG